MRTLRQVRESQGLTQVELATKSGLSYTVISRMENGHPVNRNSLRLVCSALGVTPNEIEGINVARRTIPQSQH